MWGRYRVRGDEGQQFIVDAETHQAGDLRSGQYRHVYLSFGSDSPRAAQYPAEHPKHHPAAAMPPPNRAAK